MLRNLAKMGSASQIEAADIDLSGTGPMLEERSGQSARGAGSHAGELRGGSGVHPLVRGGCRFTEIVIDQECPDGGEHQQEAESRLRGRIRPRAAETRGRGSRALPAHHVPDDEEKWFRHRF